MLVYIEWRAVREPVQNFILKKKISTKEIRVDEMGSHWIERPQQRILSMVGKGMLDHLATPLTQLEHWLNGKYFTLKKGWKSAKMSFVFLPPWRTQPIVGVSSFPHCVHICMGLDFKETSSVIPRAGRRNGSPPTETLDWIACPTLCLSNKESGGRDRLR